MNRVFEFLKSAGVYYLATVEDDRVEAKKSMLDAYPNLRGMYDEHDGNTQVLFFRNATATFYAFGKEPESISF